MRVYFALRDGMGWPLARKYVKMFKPNVKFWWLFGRIRFLRRFWGSRKFTIRSHYIFFPGSASDFPVWFGFCFLFWGSLGGLYSCPKWGLDLTPFLGVSNQEENYQGRRFVVSQNMLNIDFSKTLNSSKQVTYLMHDIRFLYLANVDIRGCKEEVHELVCMFFLEFSICFVILEFCVWVPKSMLKKLHCQCNYMCCSFYFPGSMYTYANCMHIYTNTDMCILVKINVRIYICAYLSHIHILYTCMIFPFHVVLFFKYIRYFTILHVRHDAKNENITNKWLKNR